MSDDNPVVTRELIDGYKELLHNTNEAYTRLVVYLVFDKELQEAYDAVIQVFKQAQDLALQLESNIARMIDCDADTEKQLQRIRENKQ